MNHTTLYLEKEAYILELDDVLFPRQDYLLQVYYLFASLLEYTDAQLSAEEVVSFLKETYLAEGEVVFFRKRLYDLSWIRSMKPALKACM